MQERSSQESFSPEDKERLEQMFQAYKVDREEQEKSKEKKELLSVEEQEKRQELRERVEQAEIEEEQEKEIHKESEGEVNEIVDDSEKLRKILLVAEEKGIVFAFKMLEKLIAKDPGNARLYDDAHDLFAKLLAEGKLKFKW